MLSSSIKDLGSTSYIDFIYGLLFSFEKEIHSNLVKVLNQNPDILENIKEKCSDKDASYHYKKLKIKEFLQANEVKEIEEEEK